MQSEARANNSLMPSMIQILRVCVVYSHVFTLSPRPYPVRYHMASDFSTWADTYGYGDGQEGDEDDELQV